MIKRGRPLKYNRDLIAYFIAEAISSCPPPCLPQVAAKANIPYEYLKSDLRASDKRLAALMSELKEKRNLCRLQCSARSVMRKYGFENTTIIREKIEDGVPRLVSIKKRSVVPRCTKEGETPGERRGTPWGEVQADTAHHRGERPMNTQPLILERWVGTAR